MVLEVLDSCNRSSPSPPRALGPADPREFGRYSAATRAALRAKQPAYFGVGSHEEVIDATCDALLWCHCNMEEQARDKYDSEILLGLHLLTAARSGIFSRQGMVSVLPPPNEKMLVDKQIKNNFRIASLLVDHLATTCFGDCEEFMWSAMKASWWDHVAMKVTNTDLPGPHGLGPGVCDTLNL